MVILTSTSNTTNNRNFKDLNVFVPDEANMKESLRRFFSMYSLKKTTDREFWLLDISTFATQEAAASFLKGMPNLDLDDDFYLYEERQEGIFINEYYAIGSKSPHVLQPYGAWKGKSGLQIEINSKWLRRSDFKVSNIGQYVWI